MTGVPRKYEESDLSDEELATLEGIWDDRVGSDSDSKASTPATPRLRLTNSEAQALSILVTKLDELNEVLKPSTRKPKTEAQHNMHQQLGTARHLSQTIKTLDSLAKRSLTTSSTVLYRTVDVPMHTPQFRELITVGAIVKDRGYQRMTTTPQQSTDNILLQVTIPKGATVFLSISDDPILNRVAQLRIVKVQRTEDDKFEVEAALIK
jgi:hypothetical protein